MKPQQLGSIDAWVQEELDAFFSTDGTQTKRFRAYCKIIVNGKDMTDRLSPFLVSVTVRNQGSTEADIELDDRDGRLDIPPLNAPVEIDLGWTSESSYQVFTGFISDVQHGFGRTQGGRRMFIHATGANMTSKLKTPFQDHVGEGAPPGSTEGTKIPLLQAFQQFAKNAGLNAVVGQSLAGISRDYWGMGNESIMQWGTRHADELGAHFFMSGSNVTLAKAGDFPGSLTARWGDNLIGWKVSPYVARSSWAGSLQQNFDHVQGLWNQIEQQFGLTAPWGGSWITALSKLPNPAPSAGVVKQQIDGARGVAVGNSGYGRVIINGEPKATFLCTLQIIGARPGVDGDYIVSCITHTYSRQGYVTLLEVYPNPDASTNNVGDAGYEQSNQPNQPGEAAAP